MLREYRLNRDFTIVCETGEKMGITVIQESLEWKPVLESVVVESKEDGNLLFKKLAEKYRCELGFWG